MMPDQRPSFPNFQPSEILWPTGEVKPDVTGRIRAEGNFAVGTARTVIEEGRRLLATYVPPFTTTEDLMDMSPANKREVSLINKYTLPARSLLAIIGQTEEDEKPFDLILEARMVELFSDAVAPTVKGLFDSDLWTQQLLGPLTPLWTGWLEPALLHPLRALWTRALGLDKVVEKQRQELETRLSTVASQSAARADEIKGLIENGSILEAIDLITRYAILEDKNPIPSYILALDAGRQRFRQFYEAAQTAGL